MIRQFLLVIALLFLSGCQIQTVEHFEEQQQQTEKSVTAIPAEEPTVAVAEPTPAEDVVPESEQATEQDIQRASAQLQPASEPVQKDAVNRTTQPDVQQLETAPAPEASTPATQPQLEQTPATTPQAAPKETVTLSIDAKTLLQPEHYKKLQRALQSEKYVPSDGVILAPTTYEIMKEGETVFEVLQRAVREFGIHLEVEGADENIYNSVYIEGIHHLYEFSAGNLSGWVYQVNGVAPSVGASQYSVKAGDTIRWRYTVDLGRDLDGVDL